MNLTGNDLNRFWAKVDKNGPTPAHRPELGPCWVWTACATKGYGRFQHEHKTLIATRVSFEIANGPISEGLHILHHCDNPPCLNPSHLFSGTQAENVADRHKKGRDATGIRNGVYTKPENMAWGDRHPSRLQPWKYPGPGAYPLPGEKNPNAKLTAPDVIKIRELYRNRSGSSAEAKKEIGTMFGVTEFAIKAIVQRVNWKHIP